MKQTAQLPAGAPFLKFQIDLSGVLVAIHLRWQARYDLYSVDIYDGDKPITLGRALHPGIDLLHGLNLGLGKLYLEGEEPTPSNLGIANKLIHEI